MFEEPLGLRGLPELLTAFSCEEIEKMKKNPGEEMSYGDSLWIEEMIEDFAQARGIDFNSLCHLAHYINILDKDNNSYSELQNLGYYEIPTLREAINFLNDSFENEETTLSQKFCNFRELGRLINCMRNLLEDRRNGLNFEVSSFWGTKDYEKLVDELEYRYALYYLETLPYCVQVQISYVKI